MAVTPPNTTTARRGTDQAAAPRAGRPTPADQVSIGVFYDHNWWNRVSAYYRYHSTIKARLELAGIHDIIRWHLRHHLNTPVERCTVTQAHYLRPSALPPTRFDTILTDAGITLHTVRCGHPPASHLITALAVEVFDAAVHGRVDAVALLTSDPSVLPLLDTLARMGIHTTVPDCHLDFTDDTGAPQGVHTPPELARYATSVLPLVSSLAVALDRGWPLHPPLHVSDNSPTPRLADLAGPRRRGTIHLWLPRRTFGFLLDTHDNQWYVHRTALPEGVRWLPPGAEVEFTGQLKPDPDREFPQAHQVTIVGARRTSDPAAPGYAAGSTPSTNRPPSRRRALWTALG